MTDEAAIARAQEIIEVVKRWPDANLLLGVSIGSARAFEAAVEEGRIDVPVFMDSRLLPGSFSAFIWTDEFLAKGRFERQ